MKQSLIANGKHEPVHATAVLSELVRSMGRQASLASQLRKWCNIIPNAYGNCEFVGVRIVCGSQVYVGKGFVESPWFLWASLDMPDETEGVLEIHFSGSYAESFNKVFIDHSNLFLHDLVNILVGVISTSRLAELSFQNSERGKEQKGLNQATEVLRQSQSLEEALANICTILPEAWQHPKHTAVRIVFDNRVFRSSNYKSTKWVQKASFKTPDNKLGVIEVYYLKEFPEADEGPFLHEERNLLQTLTLMISGAASGASLETLLSQNAERVKELKGINQTSAILKKSKNIEEALYEISLILPDAWQYPESTVVRITYKEMVFECKHFKETQWGMIQAFETPDNSEGLIEVYYTREFPEADEGPFLKEERNLLGNIAALISGMATKDVLKKLQYQNRERLKELNVINQTSAIIAKEKSIDDTLRAICNVIPDSWQYPEHTAVRITYEGRVYASKGYKETVWRQKENFVTVDSKKGAIEVVYLVPLPDEHEGPFLKEERQLLINLSKLVCGYLNSYKGREVYSKSQVHEITGHNSEEYRKSLMRNKQPLQLFFNKQILDKYIYLDMMKYKVKDILFVATLYDAFILETEDNFFEQFMGEIYQYSLFSLPRITGVNTAAEAMDLLHSTHFDLVVLMVGIDTNAPIELSRKIKAKNAGVPVYLLLNQKTNIKHFEELVPNTPTIDKLFVWNGNSQIIFAMVKSMEDIANVDNDTKIGLVRVILLIEDSALYYSKYLQMLYSVVFGQIQQLLPEVEKNEIDKISKMRSRPKVLHARNYEEGMYYYNKYKDFLLCVIADVEFERNGKLDKKAGVKFVKYIKHNLVTLPIVLQSSDEKNALVAEKLGVSFINKNSENLLSDIKQFLTYYLGFGDFVFRDKEGRQIAVAKTIKEFTDCLETVPDESLLLHSAANQFSLWLMSRGEIKLAKTVNPISISEFKSLPEFRHSFVETIKAYRAEKSKGKILNFDEASVLEEKNIFLMSNGSLGGKGRGLAFINTLIYNLDFSAFSSRINIRTPITAIIGAEEFERFMEHNKLYDKVLSSSLAYEEVKEHFMHGHLSHALLRKLEVFLSRINKPIAVRSSSMSEDSLSQPFAGVFDTYVVLNNSKSLKVNIEHLSKAIKLVFASIYSNHSKSYFKAIHHKLEDERMAVVLQELVGQQHGHYYYPTISGTAQSFNYYPIAHMKPEEGFAVAAVGLGNYVVGGGRAYRFSPKYPKIETFSRKDLLNSTQVHFLAVDLSRKNINYMKDGDMAPLAMLDIDVAEGHGTLNHCTSVYNPDNDSFEPGLSAAGARVINFANILKYDYIPLAPLIDELLCTIKEAQGCPVEIEYAVDLTPSINNLPSFYLLQIKPLVGSQTGADFSIDDMERESMVLYTESSLGNGTLDDITDVIFVDVDKFDKMKTRDMVKEIDYLNGKMLQRDRRYILIGPGRWGTQDQYLGIPVVWGQISSAKVIVEMSLENFPLDASLGSHFFHNVTSMNIGYFSVNSRSLIEFIQWDILNRQPLVERTTYFKHVRFAKPLTVLMNGKLKKSAIVITP